MDIPQGLADILAILQYNLFEFAGISISPLSVLIVAVTLAIFYFISRLLRRTIRRRILQRFEIDGRAARILNIIMHYLIMIGGGVTAFQMISPDSAVIQSSRDLLTYNIYTVNNTNVSLLAILAFIIILILFIMISQFFRRSLMKNLATYLKLDGGASYTISRIIHYLLMVIGAIVAFQFIGIDFSGLAVIFGFLSVGIGFGLQNVTSNFISGLILLFERPIQVGDRVLVGDIEGDVQEIKIRSTTIRSVDNISIIVPNSEFISSSVINWSHGDPKIRLNIRLGVSYDSDLDAVIRTLRSVAEANKEVLETPAPEVLLESFGDSAWDMNLRTWIRDPKRAPVVRSNLNCAIVDAFREHNIEMPFPQRDLHFRSPLPVAENNVKA